MGLMAEGRYEEACQRLEASLKLDAAMAAQFRLAECYDRLGRFATAWRHYQKVITAARYSGMPERERYARERAAEVELRLTWLVIYVPPELAANAGLLVLQDGVVQPRETWGQREPVDPGTIQIRVEAPGLPRWTHQVEAGGAGQTLRVLVPIDLSTPAPPATTAHGAVPAPPDAPETGDGGALSGQAIAGIAIGASGLAALGVGVGFGVAAMDANDESASHCTDRFCDSTGLELRDDAGVQADVSTALFIAGATALVGGAVLWLTAPSASAAAETSRAGWLRIGLSARGAAIEGAW